MECLRKESLPPGRDGTADTLRRMASFVRQSDAHRIVKATAAELVKDIRPGDLRAQAERVFYWVRDSLRYVRDIRGVEEITAPWTILESVRRGGFSHSSDCDDHSILLAALLRSIGFGTRFVAVASGRNGTRLDHVRSEVMLDGYWFPMEATLKTAPFGRGILSKVEPVALELESSRLTGVNLGEVTGDEPLTRYISEVEKSRLVEEFRAKQERDKIIAANAKMMEEAERKKQYQAEQERLKKAEMARLEAESQAKLKAQVEADGKTRMSELSVFMQEKESQWSETVVLPIMHLVEYLQSYPASNSGAEQLVHEVIGKLLDWKGVTGGDPFKWKEQSAEFTAKEKAHMIRFPSIFFNQWLASTSSFAERFGLTDEQLRALQEYFGSYIPETTYYYFYRNAINNDILLDLDEKLTAHHDRVRSIVDHLEWIASELRRTADSVGADKANLLATISEYGVSVMTTKVPVFAVTTAVTNALLSGREQYQSTPYALTRMNELMSNAISLLQELRSEMSNVMDRVDAQIKFYETMVFETEAPLYGLSEVNAKQILTWIGDSINLRVTEFVTRLDRQSERVQAILAGLGS